MKARSLVVVVALMLVATAASAAELPVSRVVLFSTGVGYFQHRGEVDGNAAMVLSCRTEQMNDILKSLVLQDLGGGSIEAVTYTPQDPLSRILASFSIPIADNPSLGELARRLRGSEVVICTGTETVRGTILGVEAIMNDEMKPYFVGPDTPLEVSENVRYVWRLAADRESLLRVARGLKVVKDLDEAGYRHHGTAFRAALEFAFEALKEAEHLL